MAVIRRLGYNLPRFLPTNPSILRLHPVAMLNITVLISNTKIHRELIRMDHRKTRCLPRGSEPSELQSEPRRKRADHPLPEPSVAPTFQPMARPSAYNCCNVDSRAPSRFSCWYFWYSRNAVRASSNESCTEDCTNQNRNKHARERVRSQHWTRWTHLNVSLEQVRCQEPQ